MRPRSLEEVCGQEKLLREGSLLRRSLESDRVPSMIFWGPPGCGKKARAAMTRFTVRTKRHMWRLTMLKGKVLLFVAFALLTGCQEEKDAYDARRLEYADVQFVIEHDRYRYTIRVFGERDTSVIRIRTSGNIEEIEGQWSSKMFDEERNQWSDSLEKARRLYWFDGIGMLKSSESILLVCDTVYQRHRMWIDFITHHGLDSPRLDR